MKKGGKFICEKFRPYQPAQFAQADASRNVFAIKFNSMHINSFPNTPF